MIDREKVIKGLECCMKWTGEPNTATCHCSDCSYTNMDILGERCLIDLINDALALLKEQEDDYKNILSDYEDLAREHEKLLDKKIPLITNGQEVVWCKDCVFGKREKNDSTGMTWIYCGHHRENRPEDWFCASGSRIPLQEGR